LSGQVVVVGSLRAGGSGKTDWVDWIAARDPARAVLVHPTGDEDAWLGSRHPGRVFPDRSFAQAWEKAKVAGYTKAVCDGGLQDPALDVCPAILLGPARAALEDLHPFGPFRQGRPSRSVDLHPTEGEDWSWRCELDLPPGTGVLLGASVAQTEIVINDLVALGMVVKAVLPTRDHAPFREDLVRALEARHPGAVWVVTAKDAARGELDGLRAPVAILRRTLEVSAPLAARLDAFLELPAHPRG
jgi:tetraacyldisaccharide-1-P 4'-kinase